LNGERYLVTGARGMLGQAVTAELMLRGCIVIPTDLPEADLTDEAVAQRLFDAVRPTRVIHCAAYTAVDRAESDAETCRRVNAEMPAVVARACARVGAAMLLVSTDFVFDGRAVGRPYREDDTPRPVSVYGQTKLDGERAVAAALERHQIVRTAWLYGPGKRNFVSAMLERLWRGERLRVVDDQTGSPTYTLDLAAALADLCGAGVAGAAGTVGGPAATGEAGAAGATKGAGFSSSAGASDAARATGTFHLVNAGRTTWCGLTRRAAELAGLTPEDVEAIPTSDYPTAARRPVWSVLDCSRAWSLGVPPMRPWGEALADYVALLARQQGLLHHE
jgi:dTDP-4-dehydrorhamnose reductase